MTLRPLTPSDCFQASRPLFVVHPDEPVHRFTKCGSAILCSFKGHSYAAIARHTIAKFTPDQVSIPVRDGINHFLAWDQYWTPSGNDDCHDFMLFHLTTATNDGGWQGDRAPIADSSAAIADSMYVSGADFAVSGYPAHGANLIDYDTQSIYNQRSIVHCEYQNTTDPFIHALRTYHGGQIEDFGGYSGGLVVARTAHGLAPAGIAITGSASSNILRFIDIVALHAGLSNFTDLLDAA